MVQFLVPPAAIIAIILGHIARRQIRRTGEDGRGIATAGFILGYAYIGILVAGGLIAAIAAAIHTR